MRLIDYFFYVLVKVQVTILKRDEEDARFSASLHTAFLIFFVWTSVVFAFGLSKRNMLADLLRGNQWGFVGFGAFTGILTVIRYFKFIKYAELQAWSSRCGRVKKALLRVWFFLFFFGMPVVSFILFRMYLNQ